VNGGDRALVDRFLDMMAAEAGAARNTLAAYRSDLEAAAAALGSLEAAEAAEIARLGEQRWLLRPWRGGRRRCGGSTGPPRRRFARG